MPTYPSLRDADLSGKRVFVRAGFDVPVTRGQVDDISRIEAVVPTIQFILSKGASVVIAAHQGRPKGKRDPDESQKPIVAVLEKLLGIPVQFADSATGTETMEKAKNLKAGEVLLLENLRYDVREEKNDPAFAQELANLADVYVNDAFTNCHRSHASMVGVPALLPSYMGLQLEQEVTHLSKVFENPKRPLTLIISGAKMETKVPIVEFFLDKGNDILLGGAIANTFIASTGFDVGASLHEPAYMDKVQELMNVSGKDGKAVIHMPSDVLLASAPTETSQTLNLNLEDIEGDMSIFDLGQKTVDEYCDIIAQSGTIVWNGPLGLYEINQFRKASIRVAEAIKAATAKGAVSIVGGGDTIDFHTRQGISMSEYTFVSTGGGAMLEFVSGNVLPALEALAKA